MGVLNPDNPSRWAKLLINYHAPFCYALCLAAYVWFALLPYRPLTTASYFSENALLPGLVTSDFKNPKLANKFYTDFLDELKDKYMTSDRMPVPWLVAKMTQLNLEVHTHNFTLNYPLGKGQKFTGVNVYGILRAPRTASMESLVLSAPYRPLSSPHKGTAAGIALMLAFAKFARAQKYWAKDIIFLITEHEQLGMQAWLEAYHGITNRATTFQSSLGPLVSETAHTTERYSSKCLDAGQLSGRAGSILAAINLELHSPNIKFVEIKVEGLNGQLPNLDLVNLVHKMCNQVHHSFKFSYSWYQPRGEWLDWKNSFKTMLGMMTTQLAGVPNGNHGLFHRFGIEAVTLEGCEANDPIKGDVFRAGSLPTANFGRLGTVVESVFRSLNNLLERFHQSYFFYLRPSASTFVSIGQYIPPLGMLVGALFIKAFAMWLRLEKTPEPPLAPEKNNAEQEVTATFNQNNEAETKDSFTNPEFKKDSSEEVAESKTAETYQYNLLNVGVVFLAVHFIGYAVLSLPQTLTVIGTKYFELPTDESLYFGYASLSLIIAVVLPTVLRPNISVEELDIIHILGLVELATTLLSIGMHNFSLGFFLAVIYTPFSLALETRRTDSKLSSFKNTIMKACFVLLHPLLLTTLAVIGYTNFVYLKEPLAGLIVKGFKASQQALTYAIVDGMIYGNWVFSVVSLILLPIWLIFWQTLNTNYTKVA